MPQPVIETRALRREFGSLAAVDSLDLVVQPRQFFGFLGPNGAGKSTTIRMLTGLLPPTAGSIRILGRDMEREPVEIKRRIGVVPEGLALFERLTGVQFLNFVGRMFGLARETAADRTEELLAVMDLNGARDTLAADYSHGMRKKLALAAALIHRPEILFLDEPFEGVDPIAAVTLKRMLSRFIERGGTVFLTSHVLELVERLCTHVGIIHRGRLVASGSLDELRARSASAAANAQAPAATLEQLFISLVGESPHAADLDWL